jgi:hypothetical protein
MGASPRCPDVIRNAIGRPRRSTTAWIFVNLPPLERPIAWASAPLFRRQASGELWRWCYRSDGGRGSSFAPRLRTAVAICLWQTSGGSDCRWLSKGRSSRAILPTAARAQDVDDPADDPAVVGPMSTGLVRRKQWSDHSPLPIIKPEFSCHNPKTPVSRKNES